jgi:hypothetical protein
MWKREESRYRSEIHLEPISLQGTQDRVPYLLLHRVNDAHHSLLLQEVTPLNNCRALIKRCAKPFSVHSTDKAAHVCNTAIVTKTTGLKEDYHNNEDHDDVEEEEFFIDWNLEGL